MMIYIFMAANIQLYLRLQWRNKDMLEAMRAVEEKKMTIRGAAKKFAVPYSTLKDRVHGRVRHGTKPGVKTALSPEEEEELVRYVKVCQPQIVLSQFIWLYY